MLALLFPLILLIAMAVSYVRPAVTAVFRFWTGVGLSVATVGLALALGMASNGYGILVAAAATSLIGLPLVSSGFGMALGGAAAALRARGKMRWAYAVLGLGTGLAITLVAAMIWIWRTADARRAGLEDDRAASVYALTLPKLPQRYWGRESLDFDEVRTLAEAVRDGQEFESTTLYLPGAPGLALSALCRPDDPDCLVRSAQGDPQILKRVFILQTAADESCTTPILAGPNRTCVRRTDQEGWCDASSRRRQSVLCNDPWPYVARLTFKLPQSQFALPDRDILLITGDLGTDSTGADRKVTCSTVRDQVRENNPHLGRLCTLRWWMTPNLLAEVEFDGVTDMDSASRAMITRVEQVFAEFASGEWAGD